MEKQKVDIRLEERAYLFAMNKHKDHKDDSGKAYFFSHVNQVANLIREITEDSELVAAAYLHDTIEDTQTTYEELEKEFGKRVADLVMEVTHDGQKDNIGYYFPRLHSKDGIVLKFADRLSNLSRMEPWDIARQEHYLKKSKFWKSSQHG